MCSYVADIFYRPKLICGLKTGKKLGTFYDQQSALPCHQTLTILHLSWNLANFWCGRSLLFMYCSSLWTI